MLGQQNGSEISAKRPGGQPNEDSGANTEVELGWFSSDKDHRPDKDSYLLDAIQVVLKVNFIIKSLYVC